ncbi:hypothetical protein N7540_008496 [Penicillium herquei]|nr:hypothetical protein N7540_008496 [Penicillium herquei]
MQMKQVLALALSVAAAEATYKGFNYGSTNQDGSTRYKADFVSQFKNAKNLQTTSGFNSARLYTMIQGGTTNSPIEAIEAAIEEDVSLLLGLWTSGGGTANEVAALKSAISTYGSSFTDLVVGISVGSEDLYRDSQTGQAADDGIGMTPDDLVDAINQVKEAISGTTLSGASIGHVDTWDAWTNSSNSAVIDAVDWLGFDGYPYFQTTDENSIENAKSLFYQGVDATKGVANGKDVWITETGWPVSGDDEGEAVASIANAKKFWDEVGCSIFGTVNTWWYIMQDYGASPSFGIVGETLSTTPLFDLSCSNYTSSSTASVSTATKSAGSSSSVATVTGSPVGRHGNNGTAASGFKSVPAASSTPLIIATATASSGSSSKTGTSGSSSGSSSFSSSSGSGSSSGSSSSSSASSSTTAYSGAVGRPSGSIFGAVVAAIALAIAV